MGTPLAAKVRGHDRPAAVGSLGQNLRACLGRQLLIDTGRRRQTRLKHLQRVVYCIPAEDRAIAGKVYYESHLSAGMARQRHHQKTRADLVAVADQNYGDSAFYYEKLRKRGSRSRAATGNE